MVIPQVVAANHDIPMRPVKLTPKQKVHIIKKSVEHTFTIEMARVAKATENMLVSNISCGMDTKEDIAKGIKTRVEKLYTITPTQGDRQKRSILPIIGDILASLTGVATERQVQRGEDKLKEVEEDTNRNTKKLLHSEVLIEELARIAAKMEEKQEEEMEAVEHLVIEMNMMNSCVGYNNHLRNAANKIYRFFELMIEASSILPYGSAPLVTSRDMEDVIKDILYKTNLVVPVEISDIYEVPVFSAFIRNGTYTYRLEIPLADPRQFTRYEVTVLPFIRLGVDTISILQVELPHKDVVVSQNLEEEALLKTEDCLLVKTQQVCLHKQPVLIKELAGCMKSVLQLGNEIMCQTEAWPASIRLPWIMLWNKTHIYTVAARNTTLLAECHQGEPLTISKGNNIIPIPGCLKFKGWEIILPEEMIGGATTIQTPEVVMYRLNRNTAIKTRTIYPTHQFMLKGEQIYRMAQKTKKIDNQDKMWIYALGGATALLTIVMAVVGTIMKTRQPTVVKEKGSKRKRVEKPRF